MPDASDRVVVVPRRVEEVEQVEMAEWVSGWLAIGSVGDPVAGYARLADGPLGQAIASFTLLVGEGLVAAATLRMPCAFYATTRPAT